MGILISFSNIYLLTKNASGVYGGGPHQGAAGMVGNMPVDAAAFANGGGGGMFNPYAAAAMAQQQAMMMQQVCRSGGHSLFLLGLFFWHFFFPGEVR